MRWAISGLLLAAAFECPANPVLIGEGEALLAAPHSDGRLPEIVSRSDRRLVEVDPLTPPPTPELDEIRGDEAVAGRFPGNFGNAFGQGDTLRNQLLRDFANPSTNPAGAPATGVERARRSGPTESGSGGSVPLSPAQLLLREAVENALKLVRDSVIDDSDAVNFSVVGVDFNLTLSGGQPSLVVNGSDVWPTILYDPQNEEVRHGPAVMNGPGGQSAAGNWGSGQQWASAQSSATASDIAVGIGSTDAVSLITAKAREFVSDPMTIIAILGCLIFWIGYEIASAVRERRRMRRHRRRAARARA